MATKDLINDIVDAMITKIVASIGTLGFPNSTLTGTIETGETGIEERAEDPAVFDKLRRYGSYFYIVPLAEGRDRMTIFPGTTDKEMRHNFAVNVTGYFNQTGETLTTALRTTRNHGFDLIDLFNGDDNQVGLGFCTGFELEQGYFENIDQVIHSFNVKIYVTALESHA